jgi:hypothetical protein
LEEALMAAQAAAAVLAKEEADSVADSDVPPTTSSKALQKAQDQVRLIESGLAVAIERDRDAQDRPFACASCSSVSPRKSEPLHISRTTWHRRPIGCSQRLQVYIDELASAIDGVRAVSGAGHHQSFLIDLTLGFEMLFLRAAQKIIPKGRAHVVSLGDRTFASLVPDPSTVAKRRGVEK